MVSSIERTDIALYSLLIESAPEPLFVCERIVPPFTVNVTATPSPPV
jgi:hypothetical protein